jgi:hypothetical protein
MVELIYHPAFNTPADHEIKKVYTNVLKVFIVTRHFLRQRSFTMRDLDQTSNYA